MRVYLDNCCYNRPYDDQTQLRISLETQAKLFIQEQIVLGKIDLVSSYVLNAENDVNSLSSKKANIRRFMSENSKVYVGIQYKREVEEKAREVMKTGVKFMDACHVVCALFAGCDYLITTDDRLLKYKSENVTIINPVNFLKEMEDKK